MSDFYLTGMGQKFYEGTMPRIASALERIADTLEADNEEESVKYELPEINMGKSLLDELVKLQDKEIQERINSAREDKEVSETR